MLVSVSRIGAFNSLDNTDAVIASGKSFLSTTITVFACLKYFLEISIAVSTLSLPLVLSVVLFGDSSVVSPGLGVGLPGVFPPGVGFFFSTKSAPLIVSTDPSGYVIVAVPSAPTSTFVGC